MRFIAHNGKWIPEHEYRRINPGPRETLHFSIFKGEYNHGLGQYVGGSGDVRAACNRIEDETGSRPVEIGAEKVETNPVLQDLTVPRGGIEAVNNGWSIDG